MRTIAGYELALSKHLSSIVVADDYITKIELLSCASVLCLLNSRLRFFVQIIITNSTVFLQTSRIDRINLKSEIDRVHSVKMKLNITSAGNFAFHFGIVRVHFAVSFDFLYAIG